LTAHPEERLGATLLDDRLCSFLVWAPRATQVEVQITSPRERNVTMEAVGRGYFRAIVEDAAAGALYRYRLDGQKERPDPVSRFQPQGVHGPSLVVDHRFAWNDMGWRGIPLETYVLYEVHVGAFTPEGTFDAAIPRIATLKELGVTAIELMPVSQFPGSRNWGYDGVYPFAVQESYGGPSAFKRFVDACHQQEIAVALDVVYNHLGPEGNYLSDFGPYSTDVYKTPWGEALNFDGPYSDQVRRYFIENALQWITEFHIDALRLDAVHAIVDPSARPFLQELGIAVHARARELGREVCVFPESDRNDVRFVILAESNGIGHDAVWNDDFHHALHVLLTGERDGYYQDFQGIEDLAKSFREGFVYSGQYSKFRRRRHGNSAKDIPGKRFIVFTQNHDQIGNRRAGDRLAQSLSLDQLKFAAGMLLLSPYLPLLFMGEEYGEPAPFQYFVSHGDADLIEAVRRGRKEEFARFDWQGEIPDPQSEQTFLNSKLNWDLQLRGSHRILWQFHRELLRLRRTVPALARLDRSTAQIECRPDENALLMKRGTEPGRVFSLFHAGSSTAELAIAVPQGRWRKLLDSADRKWGGQGNQVPDTLVSTGEVQLALSAWSVLVFAGMANGD
jgi:maltooligosyltrehalose trehalohydrolase